MNNRKLFNDKDELESSMFNFISLQQENKNETEKTISKENFIDERLIVENKNYYFSNVIARSSKTMLDCHNSKIEVKKTGTEG